MKSKIYLSIMANKGKRPECFLRFFAILLIYMQVVNSQGLPEISDMIAELSYTDGEMNHLRGKRSVNTDILEYIVIIEVNVSQAILFEQIKSSLESISSFQIDNTTEIESVNITTVCHPNGSEYQCICEDQYFWSFNNCIVHHACNDLYEGVCTCIDVFPSDGQMCVTTSELPFFDILVEIELNTTSTTMLDELRNRFAEISFPITFGHAAEITDVAITTVCSLDGTEYQCRCEDQYLWPCEKCTVYGSCGNVTNSSCGCINAIPNDGHFCQPINELMNNSTCPTEPPPAEYLIEIEISAVDVTVLDQLRNILKTLSLPSINNNINITEINITTVCSLNGTEYQCRCEDQYFWPCEKCTLYGSCGYVTNSSCGCINALPYDGHFCQPISELMNNSTCPMETRTAEYLIEIEISAVDVTVLNQLRNILKTLSLPTINSNINITEINITTVCSLNGTEYQCRCEDQYFWPCEKCKLYGSCGYVTNSSCGCINALPYDGHFCQPISELTNNSTCPMETRTAEYLIEIEISAVDVTVLNQLRNILKTLSLPTINSNINITEINITTVCSLNGTEYQCRCEDQYFWPCEKCTLYGSCGYVTNSSCGCINTLPYDGHFCQPISELMNNSTCPMETRTAEYLIEIEISAVDVTVLNQLRNILKTLSLHTINSNINITEINITTVCSLNGTEYQCRCEDQYFWPCEKCTLYGSCGYVTNSSCGCINALPYDGHFCQPISELTNNSTCPMETRTAEYLIEIEISAVDVTVLNQLRNILKTLSLPTINSNINITEINITTVCSLNGTEYQCRCEDQYFWPCEKCKLYGSCGYVTNSSCGCINALPYDGHFCQPISELTNNSTCPMETRTAEYLIEIEISAVDVTVLNQLRNILKTLSLPTINSNINITEINITTVCSLNGTEYQCRCEDQYFWPCEKCKLYGSCNYVTSSSCDCINALPYDGHFCQPINELTNNSICPPDLPPGEYLIEIEIEIDAIDVTILNQLRDILQTHSLPTINSDISVTDVNITTVCSLNGTEYQCRCEDQYFWPCEKCKLYGSCGNITNSSCGCINIIPYDGHFCQPITELMNNSICPPDLPPAEYLIEIEISAVDVTVLDQLRNILKTLSLPSINNNINITEINITTVCSLNGTEYQCRCEDQYFWPCEKCKLYGSCGYVTNSSCGCINALPYDGHFCQPISELTNNSTCPMETRTAEYLIEIEISAVDVTVLNQLRNILKTLSLHTINSNINITEINITTVCSLNGTEYQCRCEDQYFWPCEKCTVYGTCGNVTNSSCGCINAIPNDGHFCQPINELMNNSTCPTEPPPAEYLIEIEISAVDVTVLDQLRNILKTLSLPSINNNINITEINITTVCSLNGTEYQCRCEDQYFWPCEKCKLYGSCGYVTNSSCGCINALPNDGHFCQPINELMNNSTCPTEPPPAEYLIEIEISAVDVTVLDQLRNILKTLSLPSINNNINITEINITTVCSLNGTEYQCRCEDQYFWPCEKCKLYGSCGYITNSSCGCINTLPYDGRFCQPISELTINTTNTTTTSTVTTGTTAKPSIQTPTNKTTATPSIQTTIAGTHVLSFSLTINEEFDFALTDQSSEKHNTYKQKISSSIDKSYRTLPSYQPNSATVTAFRPGSVITDFTIKTTNATLNLASANQDLASSLRLLGFDVSDTAFIQSVKDGLYGSSGNIYPGTSLTLTCNPPVNNSIQWTLDGKLIEDNSNNILQLDNVSPDDSGQYACTTTVNEMPYVIWQIITIQPYPNIEVSTSKVVQCEDTTIPLQCCVQEMYQVEWNISCTSTSTGSPAGCILCDYTIKQNDCQTAEQEKHVTCKLKNPINGTTTQSHNSKSITISVSNKAFTCSDSIFGAGNLGDVRNGDCNKEMAGYQVAWCNSSNRWQPIEDYCVLRIFATLKDEAENLQVGNLPQFMANVSNNAVLQIQNITDSPATILTIVEILKIISNFSQTILINQPVMMNFLQTTDVIGSDDTRDTWVLLNKNSTTTNASSELLNSTESIARRLRDESISIITNISSLNKTSITAPFSGTFGKNLTTQINIPATSTQTSLTVIISSAFNNVLPVRNLTNNNSSQTGTSINGDVVLIETNSTINNISLSIDIKNNILGNPQCVFWNFNLLNDIGGWDSTGCQLKRLGNEIERITCECNHTTSFSILMSPFTLDKNLAIVLDYITYIGVAISLGSLVLCLIIEMITWKSVTRTDTSYMRHVSIVNIAVSLLIANICFIIGAAVVKKGEGPCSTATFFMHFFYLALFFWMLLSALLLLYRTLMVFSRMTRGAMMAIAFTAGYGAPLIIAVITVASTAGSQGYIQKDYNCWLNWSKTKALLAFVIPALTIVAINLLVLIVVLCKMLRRGVKATTPANEKHPLMVIARCVAILTPLFGLTWGFGIGTMVSPNFGIHVVFAFLNSLQGFFILLFGTLLDSKVREALARTFSLSNLSSILTRSTSA
ncbi:uncharacterized protein LOC108276944 isoform X2 [Ictalurus punctatus]|uniref:Uncharacterized protein LOC108276944 isoform X2 n=1 Tax=Ictalurus punctatus TaxID=7998 RepID=A0A9F7RTX6_ICTPU|nr:uncharacterized protein LOC108276944 isoform X2 [Ictalurus punctatus]